MPLSVLREVIVKVHQVVSSVCIRVHHCNYRRLRKNARILQVVGSWHSEDTSKVVNRVAVDGLLNSYEIPAHPQAVLRGLNHLRFLQQPVQVISTARIHKDRRLELKSIYSPPRFLLPTLQRFRGESGRVLLRVRFCTGLKVLRVHLGP